MPLTRDENPSRDIGELFGLLEGTSKDIKSICASLGLQSEHLSSLDRNMVILKATFDGRVELCDKHFAQVDERLQRDYDRLNDIEKKELRETGVKEWQNNTRTKTKFWLWVMGSLLGLILAVNQIWGIAQKVEISVVPPAAVMSAPANPGGNK
jgi:hypothetical protein